MSAGQLRGLKSRIKSVENTKKITRAMEMVSAAKLKRFQSIMAKAKPYTLELENMLGRLIQDQSGGNEKDGQYSHPFFEEREEKNAVVLVITSDTGLCGPYNSNLIELSRDYLEKAGSKSRLIGIGKNGIRALKRSGYAFEKTFTDIKTNQIEDTIKALKTELEKAYLDNSADAVYVIYSHFITVTSCANIVEKILPLKKPEKTEGAATAVPYIYEPSPESIFKELIPLYFESKIRMIFLESYVSEHMARMNAMHQATKNAKEMIDSLVLVRNKLRQAIITKEIIEIVSGSRAAKS